LIDGLELMDIDETPLIFGKYKGQTPDEIGDYDPSYVVWMFANVKPAPCSKAFAEACEQDVREYEEEKAEDLRYGFDGG
jgi:hypothetical protein